MASVHAHRSGWRAQWYDATGALIRSPVVGTREEALAIAERQAGASGRSLVDLIDLWAKQHPGRPHYTQAAEIATAWCARHHWHRPSDITLAGLDAADVARQGHGTTHALQYLLTVLRWAARTARAEVAPSVLAYRLIRRPARPPAPLLTDLQVEAIRTTSHRYGQRAVALIDYLLTYGARPITACRLIRANADLSRCTLTIPDAKHSGGWTHPASREHVNTWLGLAWKGATDADPLFPHYKDDRAWRIKDGHAREVADWYKNTIAKTLKLPANLEGIYHLKRRAITAWLQHATPATVATFTGHRDLSQVQRYDRTNQETAKKALIERLSLKPTDTP